MKELLSIDNEFKEVANRLRSSELVDKVFLKMQENCIEFRLETINSQTQFKEIENKPGVYLFYIKNRYLNKNIDDWFSEIWTTDNIKEFQHSPAIIKKRICNKDAGSEWIELYLGKTEKLRDRILAHIKLDGNKRTFALKLNARNSNLKNENFRIKWIALEGITETQIILRLLEEEIRKISQPITGRQ